jgi:hypothetical protein
MKTRKFSVHQHQGKTRDPRLEFHLLQSGHLKYTLGIVALAILLCPGYYLTLSHATTESPVYAKPGAYVFYNVQGGDVAFMAGVNGSLIYKVTALFPNNTMKLQVLANMTEGDEAPTSYQVLNYTDSVTDPKIFPAVPVSILGTESSLVFENVTCNFVKYQNVSLDQGQYSTLDYKGEDKNGTVYNFYFDRSTGIAVQMYSSSGAAIQLAGSNVVEPFAPPISAISQALPYYEDFAAVFLLSGLIFGGAYLYYRSKNKKLSASGNKFAKK